MRDIRKQHPEIIGAGDGLRSLFALRHQELSQEAARIDQEIKVGEHLRQLDLKRLGSIDYHTELENEAMRKRVEKELGDLEFRRTEYTRVLNYPKSHPVIIALDQRSAKLRALLQRVQLHEERLLGGGLRAEVRGDSGARRRGRVPVPGRRDQPQVQGAASNELKCAFSLL